MVVLLGPAGADLSNHEDISRLFLYLSHAILFLASFRI